jgi:hypothetical protein
LDDQAALFDTGAESPEGRRAMEVFEQDGARGGEYYFVDLPDGRTHSRFSEAG